MTKQTQEQQVAMFGVLTQHLAAERTERMHDYGAAFGRAGVDARQAQSILSDAQELMARGLVNEARQAINRAKWYLEELIQDTGVRR